MFDDLRKQIDEIDREILSLVAKRQEIVSKVAKSKIASQKAIYDREREVKLLEKLEGEGQKLGLKTSLTRRLFNQIIESSQSMQIERVHETRSNLKFSLCIVGPGGMGQCLAKFMKPLLKSVSFIDEHSSQKAMAENLKDKDLVFIAVPIKHTKDVIFKIGPLLAKEQILCDITSLKKEPVEWMLEAHDGPVIGMHPMFGPSTHTLKRQKVILCLGRESSALDFLKQIWESFGSEVVLISASEHDKRMVLVQGLVHISTFLCGSAMEKLCKGQSSITKTLEVTSPIYRLEIAMIGRLFSQQADLYADLIMGNPDFVILCQTLMEHFNEVLDALKNKDREAFIKRFDETSKFFDPFSNKAMKESDKLIENLVYWESS